MKTPSDIVNTFANYVTRYVSDLSQPAFVAWIRADRVILSVNPGNVKNITALTRDNVRHDISTLLGGVPVKLSNTTGLYFQVGYQVVEKKFRLDSVALNLASQPSPTAVPIGMTTAGPLWVGLEELDSVLIGGTRRMGKTYLLHAWIAALLYGGSTRLYLWDGKGGVEFKQYLGSDKVSVITDLDAGLATIKDELIRRKSLFGAAGARSIEDWNKGMSNRLESVVIIIDEAAFIPESARDTLTELIATGGAFGCYPVLATQRTGVSEVSAMTKTNLATRIAFPVPSVSDSQMILGRAGAERLPKIKGRLLFLYRAALVEAQAFMINPDIYAVEIDTPVGSDLRLFERAAVENGGRMSIPGLVSFGISEWRARKLMDDYQSRGWVIDAPGNTRVIDPGILRDISQAHQALDVRLKPAQASSNAMGAA